MRETLSDSNVNEGAKKAIAHFYPDVVEGVKKAVASNAWVVVGMAQNPVVKKARVLLDGKGIQYKYIEHGSYLSKWKQRLAIKLWSGWPTFPQVFHNGKLIGGYAELKRQMSQSN